MTIRRLDSMAALMAATNVRTRKAKGEKDTEFVKRIVNAYLDAEEWLAEEAKLKKAEAKSIKDIMRQLGI